MPVSQLLCEGSNNSPDVRLLGKLLAGVCEVKSQGDKYSMGTKINARREIFGQTVYGILDGDFVNQWKHPENQPIEWTSGDRRTHFGWRWERKEIENYLIDPIVVKHALKENAPDMMQYEKALEKARDQISIYQAARIALSANRPRLKNLSSYFGRNRGKEKYPFPENLNNESCQTGIKKNVIEHHTTQIIEEAKVLESFEVYKAECEPNGDRYQYYLQAYAGKDLYWAMDNWFKENGFIGAMAFREKTLTGIQRSIDDIAQWLPEWNALRERINAI